MALPEILQLLATADINSNARGKSLGSKFNWNINRNHIRSISSYGSNSIFYFHTTVSDQCTPEEVTMVSRALEKSYASFVVSCVNLMPFHRIRADDQGSIEEYLRQFHQNMGISDGGNAAMRRAIELVDANYGMRNESVLSAEEIAEAQKAILECWNRAKRKDFNFIEEVQKAVPLIEMFNQNAVDPLTKALQEQYWKNMAEMETWGFLGEAEAAMFDGSSDSYLTSDEDIGDYEGEISDEDYDELLGEILDDEDDADLLDDEWEDDEEFDELLEGALARKINGSTSLWEKYYAQAIKDGKGENVARELASRKVQQAKDALKKNKEIAKERIRSAKLQKTINDNRTKRPGKMLYGNDNRVQSVKGDPRKRIQEAAYKALRTPRIIDEYAILQEALACDDIYQMEALCESLSSPVKNKLKKLEEIRKMKPSEYDGPKEIKEFIDKNYNTIKDAAEVLEKEPREMRKMDVLAAINGVTYIIGLVPLYLGVSYAGAGMTAGAVIAVGAGTLILLIGIAISLMLAIATYFRRNQDSEAAGELYKIRNALKAIDKKKIAKLPTPVQKKFGQLVSAIDDVETESETIEKEDAIQRDKAKLAAMRQMAANGYRSYGESADGWPIDETFDYAEAERMLDETVGSLNELHMGQIQAAEHEFNSRFSGYLKNAKSAIASANKHMRKGDYAGARKNLKFALTQLREGRKNANKIDDDGWIAGWLKAIALGLLPIIGPVIWTIRGFTGWYHLRKKSKAGEMEYSKTHPKLKPNVFLEYLGMITTLPRARGYSRANVLESYDKLISTVEATIKSIDNMEDKESKISESAVDPEIIDEAFLSLSPLRGKLKRLEEIRNAAPSKDDEGNEVTKFLKDNLNDIKDIASTLENEPAEFRKNNDTVKALQWITYCAAIASIFGYAPVVVTAAAVITIDVILTLVYLIIAILRSNEDRQARRDLSAILAKLKTIDTSKYPEAQKKKVEKCVKAIESANKANDNAGNYGIQEAAGADSDALTSIRATVERISENKIKSCTKLTVLMSMKSELEALKKQYTKYLNRYKAKYQENERKGTDQKLTIKFEGKVISDPRAFMREFGEVNKIVNRRLALIEARSQEMHSRKGLPMPASEQEQANESVGPELGAIDIELVRRCRQSLIEALAGPDSGIFGYVINEAPRGTTPPTMVNSIKDVISTVDKGIDLYQRASGRGKYAEGQSNDHWAEEHQYMKNPPAGGGLERTHITYEKGRGKSGLNVAAAAGRYGNLNIDTFGGQVFTNMDMKKANEAVPTFANATITFIVDDTEQIVTKNILIGIKVTIESVRAKDLIDDTYQAIMNKRKFLKFIKWTTGEEKSLADLLFCFKEMKLDAVNANRKDGFRWLPAFRSRKRWNKFSVPYLTGKFNPNGTVVMTMNEINFIKNEYGLDVLRSDHMSMLMSQNFLLGFVVLDQANEIAKFMYDGHTMFEDYPYKSLEREQNQTDRMLRDMMRMVQK